MTEIKKTTTTTPRTLEADTSDAQLNPVVTKDISVDTTQLDGMRTRPNPTPPKDDDPPENTEGPPPDDDDERTF